MGRITTVQYVRKPIYVDAVRITGANFDAIATWCQGEIQVDEIPGKGTGKKYIKVRVHNPKNARQTKAYAGDWILYTERGYKVYTNKAFNASFEAVTTEGQEKIDPAAAEGKKVLSVAEQETLDPTEIRELVQTGEAVLAQDIAAA